MFDPDQSTVARLEFSDPTRGDAKGTVTDVRLAPPAADHLTVRLEAAGINFIDHMARCGVPGYATEWPWVGGLEGVGIVQQLGDGVTGPAPGTRVAAFGFGGAFAEVAEFRADLVVPVPEGVDPLQAAATPLTGVTALLLAGGASAGDRVLMHSASGGLGAAIAAVLPDYGALPAVGIVGREASAARARDAGWTDVVVRSATWIEDLVREGNPFDLIFDPVGAGMTEQLDLLAPGGRLVVMGNASGGDLATPQARELIARNVSVTGFSVRGIARQQPKRVTTALSTALQRVADGSLQFPVHQVSGLAEISDALDRLSRGDGVGKYVADLR
jgi:NADPH2:quinone reductase